ncbi:FadR/GntR family transcriptional regulator [Brachybacterium kimchii]|uniref:FadR family transcriptional regulator n=1 Tax=Brachybacterium kimchii TaxID=2942909 RepID=A0ABY4N710_9MICO|nr:FadR/GntR family transcriptional regulator [Brachybacterium kimchii]UQN29228.1 FadR family transcriptional regulator [Brachybacterium kimchii]
MTRTEGDEGRLPLSHQAQQAIRQHIVDNGLHPGDPLPSEGEFCQLLGMSKSSVREGIRRLEMLGIVDVRRGRGLYVGAFSLRPVVDALPYQLTVNDTSLREILQVRAAIEEALIVQASKELSEAQLDALDELVAQMREKSMAGEVPRGFDHTFHLALFEPLRNQMLNQLIETFWEVHARFAAIAPAPINHHAVEDHQEIIDAIRSGDAQRMTRAVAVHFAPIQSNVEAAPTSPASAPEGRPA